MFQQNQRVEPKTALRAAVADLDAYADQLDAKGAAPTAAETAHLQGLMKNLENAKTNLEIAEASSFLKQLSGGGDGMKQFADPITKEAWAAEVATRLTKTVGDFGIKAITTGGIDIPQAISPVVTKPVEPARVLDLFSRTPIQGNEFEYLRQSVRTNNAAVVADAATKPTSVYTFEDESDRARVFAHLSEAIPVRYLEDHQEIRNVLSSQMAGDLYLAIEADALVGDGLGEHWTGLADTAGVQAQAFATDVLTTLRKARTKLTTSGEAPTAWVLNHADLEAIDLTREDGATGGFMEGIEDKIFGNLPRIGSSVVPAGTAYLGNWDFAKLFIRQAGRLDADMSGTLFEKNQVKLRYEGRFGWAVLRPNAFVEIDLTA